MTRYNTKFLQGTFIPMHPEKYKGTKPIIYRSSYELKMMRYLDNNNNVIQWGSETQVIPYKSPFDGKIHRYFVDFYAFYKINNKIYKFLIEVKPYKKLFKPEKTSHKKQSTLLREQHEYVINKIKFEAATQWAKKKGYDFKIITEKELQ